MDVFGTVVTSGALILQFLGACADYSEDARSLKHRFDWDLRILEEIDRYFKQRQAQSPNQQLDPSDAVLLERTAEYLDHLINKAKRNLGKIQRKGFLGDVINRGLWVTRQAELKEMVKEVHEWTKRFDIHLLGLPQELRVIIPTASDLEPPPLIKANNKIRQFVEVSTSAKEARAKEIWLENSDELASDIISWGSSSFLPVPSNGRQLVFTSRKVLSDVTPGTKPFENLKFEMGVLAATLNCLNPAAQVRLLQVESYFYHHDSRQFLFVHSPPEATVSMMTLENAIDGGRFPATTETLDQRLNVAMKLAEAVLFLHAAGFVHKNITSSSVVIFEQPASDSPFTPSDSQLDNAYLMGFDLIRDIEAITYKEGAVRNSGEEPGWLWRFGIFQHPDRLAVQCVPRYTKTYDVYSLGVILLEIGLWEPLSHAVRGVDRADPVSWTRCLAACLSTLSCRMGERYKRMVAWCLELDGRSIVKEEEFVNRVLTPLEEMVSSLS